MQAIVDSIGCIVTWLSAAITQVFVDVWEVVRDLLVWVASQGMSLAMAMLNSFDWTPLLEYTGQWNALPAGVVNYMGALGVGQAFGVIVTALVIRLLLQLIPFVRLGS